MTSPTLDQTAAIWIIQAWDQEYCYVQDIFPGDTHVDRAHRNNCRLLIKKHCLIPEVDDGLKPYLRFWDMAVRYHLIPAALPLPVGDQNTQDNASHPSEAYDTLQTGLHVFS